MSVLISLEPKKPRKSNKKKTGFFSEQNKRKRRSGLPTFWNAFGYTGDSWKRGGSRLIDIKGKRFWNILVIKRDRTKSSRAYAYWMCDCDCGRRYSIRSDRLRNGLITCCFLCSQKVRRFYKRLRDEKRWQEQIEREKVRRLHLIKSNEPIPPSYVINPMMYSKGNITRMRREWGFSIKEISETLRISQDEVRAILTGSNTEEGRNVEPVVESNIIRYQKKSKYQAGTRQGLTAKELRAKLDQKQL